MRLRDNNRVMWYFTVLMCNGIDQGVSCVFYFRAGLRDQCSMGCGYWNCIGLSVKWPRVVRCIRTMFLVNYVFGGGAGVRSTRFTSGDIISNTHFRHSFDEWGS